MILKIRYTEHRKQPVAAAFLPGAWPADWFAELNAWGIPIKELDCYILPQSIADNSEAGLFVIFDGQIPKPELIRYPYTKTADKLYIPFQAELWPVTQAGELQKLLLWDIQVFHPVIGLVGFEAKDKTSIAAFVHLRAPQKNDWSFAHPGLPSAPVLQQIGLEAEEQPEDVMDAIREDVGTKSLEDIPAANPDESKLKTYGKKALNVLSQIGLYLLLILALIGKTLFMPLSWFFTGSGKRSSSSTGLLQKLEQWIGQKLADIEKQRDTELKRLMDLFDKDSDEALQYAIPLNSPYLNRGTAPQSGRLSRRSTAFDLRSLGGGRRVDGWDLGAYNAQLRARYIKAANDAVAEGNFKRAAYVYAHLLGDFYSAANVLQQGKHYREAAELYRKHLKNERLAAECLEKGGLLEEAIPLYLQLGQLEKAGDLYQQMGKPEKAEACYRERLTELRTGRDHKKAADLVLHKLNSQSEAEAILLEGWADTSQPEQCLSAYLDLRTASPNNNPSQEVQQVYTEHVPRLKRTAFLTVLAEMNRKHPEEQLAATSLGIAYEIVHQQVDQGDTSGLKLMTSFLPGDRLMPADTTRFIQHALRLPPVYTKPVYIQLRQNTQWLSLITYHDQILGLGQRQGELHLMRGNWQGHLTYQFLFKVAYQSPPFTLIADNSLSDQLLITGQKVDTHINQHLGAYSYFDREAVLQTLDFLPDCALSCCLNGEGGVTILHFDIHGLLLSDYTMSGALLKTRDIHVDDERINPSQSPFDPGMMVWRKGHFYYATGEVLLRFGPEGPPEILGVNAPIRKMAITGQHTALKIALLTDEGCVLVTPLLKEMQATKGFFAQDIPGEQLKLMSDNRLVVAAGKRAAIYDISKPDPSPEGFIDTENPITAILAIPKRHHCAFLEADGRISMYHTEPTD